MRYYGFAHGQLQRPSSSAIAPSTKDIIPNRKPCRAPLPRRETSHLLGHLDQVPIGKMCKARRCQVLPVPEQPADQGKILAGHDGMAGYRVSKVTQAKVSELRLGADRAPAMAQRMVALFVRIAREQEDLHARRRARSSGASARRLREMHEPSLTGGAPRLECRDFAGNKGTTRPQCRHSRCRTARRARSMPP